eukprot:23627-Eustigmatos_ZCMA.PRE.1
MRARGFAATYRSRRAHAARTAFDINCPIEREVGHLSMLQIKEREEALREAEKEAERDKARIDAIIQKITEEDRREYEERIKRK